jgi:hypothetical protein
VIHNLNLKQLIPNMSQFLVLCAMMAVVFVQFAQAQLPVPLPPLPVPLPDLPLPDLGLGLAVPTVCPAGYFADLLLCYPCPAGSTSIAGVTCVMCPMGSYSPSPGSATCFACAKGYDSAPAGELCYKSSDCAGAKASKKGGKRRLREGSDSEMEEDAESMFSF